MDFLIKSDMLLSQSYLMMPRGLAMKYLIFLTTFCGLTLGLNRIDPLVSTKVGLIRGLTDDNGIVKFLGVPYGKVGSNPFGAATPHPDFDDIFEANDDTNVCPQISQNAVTGSIDCLNLNIYVPANADSENPLPVMVWIHGGGFIGGSAIRDASNPISLLRHDVIVVAINYRLGIYGFMCLEIPEVPGNTGLKDQVLALRWINENIEAFGGDPNRITVFGTSAGGMSTNLHLFSSYENLFQRAIIQSGPAYSYWMMVESDTTIPIRLAEALGLNTADIYEALAFLAEINPVTIVQLANSLQITASGGGLQALTKPCVEQEFEGVEHFITDHPMNMLSNKASTTSIIIGNNNNELGLQFSNFAADYFDTYDFSIHFAMGFDMSNDLTEPLEIVNHFYLGDKNISVNELLRITDFGSDIIFNHPSQRMAQTLQESGGETIYRYVFSYPGNSGRNKTWSGASHGEEAPYVFGSVGGEEISAEDQLMVDRMTTLWTNFAKYGDPTPETSELIPVKWSPITATTQTYLDIDSDLYPKSRPFHSRMAFWDLFYKRYGHYQKWYKP